MSSSLCIPEGIFYLKDKTEILQGKMRIYKGTRNLMFSGQDQRIPDRQAGQGKASGGSSSADTGERGG